MDEEKQTQEVKPDSTTEENSGAGDKYETTPIIERAREERERMEAANKKKEELLDREEKLQAKSILGGKSEGKAQEEVKKEKTPQEYAEAYERGEVDPFKEDGYV